jgi:hypothetical protein
MAPFEPGPKLAVDESTPPVLIRQMHFSDIGNAGLQSLDQVHVDHKGWHAETAPSSRFSF